MKSFKEYSAMANSAVVRTRIPSEIHEEKVPNLYDPIVYTLEGGGKRLRPVLTLMACESVGGKAEDAVEAAVGVEIFHNFTLLHDDVMDKSDTRRGRPSVHARWDENTAILSGDAMLTIATQTVMKVPDHCLRSVLETFNDGAMAVYEGQALDMEFETLMQPVTLERYIRMITLKTGALLGTATKIGALVGNASDKVANALYDFGIKLGIAFQIHDDYLDMYGDEKTLGKPIGGDVQNNKQTFLLLTALARGGEKADALRTAMKMERGKEKLIIFREIYDSMDMAKACREAVNDYCRQALEVIEVPGISDEGKKAFADLVQLLVDREK